MKTLVTIPTYNEKENIKDIIECILNLHIDNLEILVIDDDSPDGTSRIVKKMNNPKVHLLLRKTKKGRGFAGVAGFKKAIEMGADYIIEMDADFSHDPKHIPRMLRAIKSCDVVLGSRLVKGGKQVNRNLFRRTITRLANIYIRIVLGLRVKDCNSGYRCFRRSVFVKIHLDKVFSEGPAIVQELLYKAHLRRFKICEIPIVFCERTKGSSTLTWLKILKGYTTVLSLKWKRINHKLEI